MRCSDNERNTPNQGLLGDSCSIFHSAEKPHVVRDLNFRFALQEAGKWILAGRVETGAEPGRGQQGEGGAGKDGTKFRGYNKIVGKVRENI